MNSRNIQGNESSVTDTSPLILTRYWEAAALAIASGTPKYLSSDATADIQIPHDARFVRIHGVAVGIKIRIQSDTPFASKQATTANSMQAVADQPEWFQLPVTADRTIALDALVNGTCLITFGG